jgi:hypothetical protein
MKLLFLLSITFFYGIGIFLSVLGSLRHRNGSGHGVVRERVPCPSRISVIVDSGPTYPG